MRPDPDDLDAMLDYYSLEDLLGLGLDTSVLPDTPHTGHDGRPVWPRDMIVHLLAGDE